MGSQKEIIETKMAPTAIGPYSQATCFEQLVFVSGQISIDPATQQVEHYENDVAKQTKQVLENLMAVLEFKGLTCDHVLKTTIFLKNMDDFSVVNEVYARYFNDRPPARATVAVSGLPKDVLVEIDAVAFCPRNT